MKEAEIKKIVENTVSSFRKKSEMTLSLAEKLSNEVLLKASSMGVKAVVCVSDSAGNPKVVKSMDDA